MKIRDEGVVRNKAVYLALGVDRDGQRDVLGLWIEQTEGAKFWMKVVNDLRNRGVEDLLIAVVDGLKGFPEAIAAVFPKTTVQTCIVHLIRDSLAYASWKDRELVAASLRPVYTAASETAAAGALAAFEAAPGGRSTRPSCELAARLGAGDPVLRVPAGSAPDHLHDQRYREPAHAAAQDHQDARSLPHRRGGHEADLARAAQRDEESQSRRREWISAMNQFALMYPDRFPARVA